MPVKNVTEFSVQYMGNSFDLVGSTNTKKYTVQKKKRITHFYFSKCKFFDLPGKIK
jgi:hypothetical protein